MAGNSEILRSKTVSPGEMDFITGTWTRTRTGAGLIVQRKTAGITNSYVMARANLPRKRDELGVKLTSVSYQYQMGTLNPYLVTATLYRVNRGVFNGTGIRSATVIACTKSIPPYISATTQRGLLTVTTPVWDWATSETASDFDYIFEYYLGAASTTAFDMMDVKFNWAAAEGP